MFTQQNQIATLEHVNLRTEKHGPEDVLAVDLKIGCQVSNEELKKFHPDLMRAFFIADDEPQNPNEEMPFESDEKDALRKLKFSTHIQAIQWQEKFPQVRFVIDFGIGDEVSNIILPDAKIKEKVNIALLEGGSARIVYTVSASSGLTEEIVAKLSHLLTHEITVSFERLQEVIKEVKEETAPKRKKKDLTDSPFDADKQAADLDTLSAAAEAQGNVTELHPRQVNE